MGVIYLRTNRYNGKKYVGQAVNIERRQREWKYLSFRYGGKAINNARAKYGIDAFDFEILKECEDEEMNKWEMYYIKELNTKVPNGYNMTDGGDGVKGCHISEEHKKKISTKLKGKHLSEEHKKKIGKANKGKKRSEEYKNNLSVLYRGRSITEETRKKMSEKAKGKKVTEETRKKLSENHKGKYNTKCSKPILQINRYTNEVIAEFPSIIQVQRDFGYNNGAISKCCKGKLKSAYNFIWKYKEESVA